MKFPQSSSQMAKFGEGNGQTPYPQRHVENYRDFSKGLVLSTLREGLPVGATPFAQDMIVTTRNRLRMAPGSTLLEGMPDHEPEYMLLHGSLDFTAELLLLDPPFIGVKRTDAIEWLNVDLSRGPFAWANFGGTLILTDGQNVWARQPNNLDEIGLLEEAPVAATYASWAGRVWAGAAQIDGNTEPLVLAWSAANSDYRDWTGLGSGFEALIDDMTAGDRIVALKPMGLDFMAIMLRRSIWVATRTGLRDRPGEIKSRVSGSGAVSLHSTTTTQFGVMYLSDDGVKLFDGNTVKHLSESIDPELLPLDYARLSEYRMTYDLMTSRLFLHVPSPTCQTWMYETLKDRWFKLTNPALASVSWPVQVAWLRWMDLIGSWGEQEPNRWVDYGATSEGRSRMIWLGDVEETSVRTLEEEDEESTQYFGLTYEGIWELRPISDASINRLITMKEFQVEYFGQGRILFWAPNIHGAYERFAFGDLPLADPPDVAVFTASKVGRILGLQLRCCTPHIEILQVGLEGQMRSKRIEVLTNVEVPEDPDPTDFSS